MTVTMSKTYLITGANRGEFTPIVHVHIECLTGRHRLGGLGRALVEAYLVHPHITVIAAVRDTASSSSHSLHDLPKSASSRLILVKIDSSSPTDADEAVSTLRREHNINSLDVVIANAGISKVYPCVVDVLAEDMLEHFTVNVIGVVYLYRAVRPLLLQNHNPPIGKILKFVTMSSSAGSIEEMEKANVPNAAYGTSKAALNYITKKIHMETRDSGLCVFALHPGWVQTDMGNAAALVFGLEKAQLTVEESLDGMVSVIENATEKSSGKLLAYDGTEAKW